jgi:hypothetical protein
MASRLLSTNGLYSPRTFVRDEIKTNKLRQLIKKSSSSQLSIKNHIEKQRIIKNRVKGHFSGLTPDFS